MLGERDSARLEAAMIGLERLRRESDVRGVHQLVVACARGEEATYRRALVDAGMGVTEVARLSCRQLCEAYGVNGSTAGAAARVDRHLRECSGEVAAWLEQRLLGGSTTMSWMDQARRLVPPGGDAESAIAALEELEPLSARELREVARGARGAGSESSSEDERRKRRRPGESNSVELLEQLDAARQGRRLRFSTCAEVLLDLKAALAARIQRYGLPGEENQPPVMSQREAWLGMLRDAITVYQETDKVRWHIDADGELDDLLTRVALEIRRAHDREMTLEEVLVYLIRIEREGSWPTIEGKPFLAKPTGDAGEPAPLAAPSRERSIGPPRTAQAVLECATCDRRWTHDRDGLPVLLEQEQVDELLLAAGSPGRARVRWLPAALDEECGDPSRSQPRPDRECEAIDSSGGCVVPCCPHGAHAEGQRPGVVRAFELRPGGLTPLCPTHWRALVRERLQVEWPEQGLQPRWHTQWTSHTPEIIGEGDSDSSDRLSPDHAHWLLRRRRSPPVPA